MNLIDPKILTTDAQRKAFMHPTRCKIIDLLTNNPMTVSQTAKKLGVHPANLTHHFKKLTKANIIYLYEKRDIGRVIEKYYQTTSTRFVIDQVTDGANAKVLSFLKNDITKNIAQLRENDEDDIFGIMKWTKINEKNFEEFSKKMQELIDEYSEIDDSDGINYALNLSLYPQNIHYGPIKKMHINKRNRKKS